MTRTKTGELPIPPAAVADENAVELVRVWAAGGQQHASIASGAWRDPAAWGLMLVDLAQHVARAYAQSEGRSVNDTLARIKEGFDAEWAFPTD